MGCASSTEYQTDPATGEEKKKKRLGGAYPGQRRPQHAPYQPNASAFDSNNQATVHFVAYGKGNALTLVKQDGSSQPESGKPQAEYIQVTLPSGVAAGDTIHVQAPDGRLNAIVVPDGMGPGSVFTVEFAPPDMPVPGGKYDDPISTTTASAPYSSSTSAPYSSPPPDNGGDDGFASQFGNPYHRPPAEAPTANAAVAEGDVDLSSYPTTTATPVYSNSYNSNNYNTYKP